MTLRRDGPRPAVIGTCALTRRGIGDGVQLLANGLAMVDAMARQADERGWALDLAVLPETFAEVDGSPPADSAQALDGETVRAVAERARRYGTHAIVPLRLRQGDRLHNSVVLLDRAGRVAGLLPPPGRRPRAAGHPDRGGGGGPAGGGRARRHRLPDPAVALHLDPRAADPEAMA